MMERLSVLVLDNDSTSLSIISEMLEKLSFKVFPFRKAEEALDFIKHGAAKESELDMVLVEVNLNNMAPGSSANSELLHHILNELQVPLITMCSYGDEETLSKCMNLGACYHVLKPLDTGSLNMLWHQALQRKSKKTTPEGTTLNRTEKRMVSSSTKTPKEKFILEREKLSDPEYNGFEEPKKRNRLTWTIELHEKFLDAVEALGGNEYATPEGILRQMNAKGLTSKHIGSHLQKHRSRHQNAKQGEQCQENANTKLVPELMISAQDGATSESITPGVVADMEVYPSRLWTQMKKRSVEATDLQTGMYTCTSGNYRDNTGSVWDKYHKNLQKVFSESNKRWLFMSKCPYPWKNNLVVTDEGVRNEAPKTAAEICYGASIEIPDSSNLTNDQVRENNRAEADRDNNTVGSINFLEGYGASIKSSGSSSLLASDQVGENNYSKAARANDNVGDINLPEGEIGYGVSTSDQVRQNRCTEATRDNDILGSINLPQGCGAFIEISGSDNLLTSNQVGENNHTEFARDNDDTEIINLLEGVADTENIASMDFSVAWAHLQRSGLDLTGPFNVREEVDSFSMSLLDGSQEHQSIGLQDPFQVGDNACNAVLKSVDLIDKDVPVAQELQEQQNLGLEDLQQVGDSAWKDALIRLTNLLDEPIVEEADVGESQEQQSLALDLEDLLQVGDK